LGSTKTVRTGRISTDALCGLHAARTNANVRKMPQDRMTEAPARLSMLTLTT
jgi:hypothetical protein